MPHSPYSASILTLGCKVNQYESEAIAEGLRARGVEIREAGAALVIVNTCAVTGEAERKCRAAVRRAARENPGSAILVTGCMAQVCPEKALALPGVAFVCGNRDKVSAVISRAMEILEGKGDSRAPTLAVEPLEGAGFEPIRASSFARTRAFLKIEDGCDARCAYCIIPRARGPVRSKPARDVLTEARDLCAAGYRELVLTGIEVSSYGVDLPDESLPALLEQLDETPGLARLRLSSLDPACLTVEFVTKIKKLRHFAPHFHLSLQSGCSDTLARMRRRYTAERARENALFARAALPDLALTADIIVGFPGESEREFQRSCDFLASPELSLLSSHIFPYSPRVGTPAASMPGQIPEREKRARAAHLARLLAERRRAVLEDFLRSHPTGELLIESRGEDGRLFGRLPNYIGVAVEQEDGAPPAAAAGGGTLRGEAAGDAAAADKTASVMEGGERSTEGARGEDLRGQLRRVALIGIEGETGGRKVQLRGRLLR